MADYSSAKAAAAEVKEEELPAANTSIRVGEALESIIAAAEADAILAYRELGVCTTSTTPATYTLKDRVQYDFDAPVGNSVLTNFGGLTISSVTTPSRYKIKWNGTAWSAVLQTVIPEGRIVQEVGQSTTALMSQKAVSDELNDLELKVGDNEKTLVLNNSNFSDMFNGGDKVYSATGTYNGFVVELIEGIEYAFNKSTIMTAVTTNSYPIVGSAVDIIETLTLNPTGQTIFEATSKYIFISVTINNFVPINLIHQGYGLTNELGLLQDQITVISEDIDNINASIYTGSDIQTIINPSYLDHFYNTNDVVIGSTFNPTQSALVGTNCYKRQVVSGETYIISGYGTSTVGLYVVTSNDNEVVSLEKIKNSRVENVTLDILADGYLYVNLLNYSVSTDFVKEITFQEGIISRLTTNEENLTNIENNISEIFAQSNEIGAKMLCFGDSITEFGSDIYKSSFLKYLGVDAYVCGIGGTRLAQRDTPTDTPTTISQAYAGLDIVNTVKAFSTQDFTILDACSEYVRINAGDNNTTIINRLKSILPSDINIVTIFGGTNDYTGGSVWGAISDADDGSSNGTISGSIKYMVKALLTANPKLKIYIFTPIVRYMSTVSPENWSDVNGAEGARLPDLCEFIDVVCQKKHIPCSNWYWNLGWNQDNFAEYFTIHYADERGDVVDTTHPFGGWDYLAEKMAKFIRSH